MTIIMKFLNLPLLSSLKFTILNVKIKKRLQKLSPSQMELLIRTYNNTSSKKKRDELRKNLTEKISRDHSFGELLTTDFCKKKFENEELYNYVLAAAYFGLGEKESTVNILKKLQSKNPTVLNYLLLAHSYMDLNKNQEAIKILKEGLQKHPDNFDIIMSLGTIYFSIGDTTAANTYVDKVRDNPFFHEDFKSIKKLTYEIQLAVKNKIIARTSDGDIYDDNYVKDLWHAYWVAFNSYKGSESNESRINHIIQEKLGYFLRNRSPNIGKVVNFGVMCGYPDYCIAKKFPNTQFFCVDRQEIVQKLNESGFNLSNLSFMSGDIIDLLPKIVNNDSNSVFHHVRTGCLCYPEFLKLLYKKCFEQKIEYIIFLESYGLSKHDKKFYNFQDLPAVSIGYRSNLFLHNYPKILSECGYKILVNEMIVGRTGLEGVYRGYGHVWIIAQRQ